LATPRDHPGVTLIHEDSQKYFQTPADWWPWSKVAKVQMDNSHGPRLSQADHPLDAAFRDWMMERVKASRHFERGFKMVKLPI